MRENNQNGKGDPVLRIIRSTQRRKTISARLIDDGTVLEVLAPAGVSDAELDGMIQKLRGRLLRQAEKRETADDKVLTRRAQELNREYFGGRLRWNEIKYVTNQRHRFGSCTPATATIRISHRVAAMPAWVRDYVILHELAHLAEPNHSRRFWKLVERYPRTERARGYLMALGLDGEGEEPIEGDLEPL